MAFCRSLLFQQRASYHNVLSRSTTRALHGNHRRRRNSSKVFHGTATTRRAETTTTTAGAAAAKKTTNQPPPPPPPPPPPQETSPTPNWQVYLVIVQRIAMAWGMIHVVTEYGVDVTLCDGPSMTPTIQPSGEMLLMERVSTRLLLWRFSSSSDSGGSGVKDGDTAAARIQAARARQQHHRPTNVWHEPRLRPLLGKDETAAAAIPPNRNCSSLSPSSWQDAWEQLTSPLSVGDVVVTDHPHRPGTICKRLVALPGDQVMFKQTGRLVIVPDGHVWLEGDNAVLSHDSRYYGPIPMALIRGRAISRIWPLRGSAWLSRLRIPSGSTVLPAGYQGEHIAYSQTELEHLRGDDTE
jgi:signal peptidase I